MSEKHYDELRGIAEANQRTIDLPRGILTPQRRENVTFLLALAGMFIALLGSVITGAIAIDRTKTTVENNRVAIVEVKAAQVTTSAELKALARTSAAAAKANSDAFSRLLEQFDFKFINDTVRSLNEQREYGLTNAQWYRNKYGRAPIAEPTPLPH